MKKNKSIILVVILCITFTAPSCKKWLTVNPRTQVISDIQFSSEKGFQDALTGVYLQMKSRNLYGKAMSYGAMEFLMSSWEVSNGSTEQYLSLFNYQAEGVQTVFKGIAEGEYRAIAGINEILSYIDERREVFTTPGMYEMIKSECLGLRAYCHLDLLRLFGPVPEQATDKPILPYVTTVSVLSHPYINFSDYLTFLQQDLKTAGELIKDTEPFKTYSNADYINLGLAVTIGSFASSRFVRMNYFAIKALQARAFLWTGLTAEAYTCAAEVIKATIPNGNTKFPLGNDNSYAATDLTLISEHMFGLYDFEMTAKYDADFSSGVLKKGSSETTVKSQLYGNTGTDLREMNLWTTKLVIAGTPAYIFKKYGSGTTNTVSSFGRYMIPLLRVSEMYLIAAETAPDMATAQQYWSQFRTARNLAPASLPADKQQLQLTLAKEFQREFYGEGQSFYTYKRINAPSTAMIWPPSGGAVNYVIPFPQIVLPQ